ncbi:MAG: hypothetical protein M0C28_45215 [Candidatus Moduliflexus flocculans]|nr:hypothetical protein [Candidatus Moduliflexus flocculans]
MSQSTLAQTGMKIYVSADGKKSKDAGILFHQKPMTADELIASLEAKGEVLSEDRKSEIRKQTGYKAFLEEPIVPKKGAAAAGTEAKPEPATFRSVQQGKLAIYEFKIPLSRIGQPGGVQPGASPQDRVRMGRRHERDQGRTPRPTGPHPGHPHGRAQVLRIPVSAIRAVRAAAEAPGLQLQPRSALQEARLLDRRQAGRARNTCKNGIEAR